MTETELNNGEIYIYKDQYETMEVIVSFSRTLEGSKAFKIRLNDKPVIISKAVSYTHLTLPTKRIV